MHIKITFRQVLPALVVLCIVFRLIFVYGNRQLPVMWDARIYSAAGLGLLHYIKNPDKFGHPELDPPADTTALQLQFTETMKEYIDGEQIVWLAYDIPTTSRAQHYVFLSGPVLPVCLAGVFILDVGSDFTIIRTFNVLIDGLCLLLLMLITARLMGRRAAILAGVIYILYLPFILITGMVSPEPITIFLILLTLYLVLLWYDSNKIKYISFCGLALGLLVLTKPTAVLLFLPFGAGFLYDYRKDIRGVIRPIIRAAIPFLVITLPWIIATSLYFDRPAVRDPDYSTSNLRSSSSIEYEGYDLDYVDKDFWKAPVYQTIINNPLKYGQLLLKKFSRLWSQPYNDFNLSFLMNQTISTIIHFVIVLTGLFGILYFLVNKNKGLIYLLLIPLYYTAIHIIFHSLARYNLNAMPFIIIASSLVIIKIVDYIRDLFSKMAVKTVIFRVILFIACGLFLLFFPERPIIDLLGVSVGMTIFLIFKIMVITAMLYSLYKILSVELGLKKSIRLMGVPSALLLILLLALGSSTDSWAEWKCRLKNPKQAAAVRIYFPENFRLLPGDICRVMVDMVTNHNRKNPFYISTNGQEGSFYINRPPISQFYYQKATYDVFQIIYGIGREEMRCWRSMPYNSMAINKLIDSTGYIEIMIRPCDSFAEEDSFIDLYGYYPSEPPGEALIPSLSHYSISIERFVEKGDPRIWVNYILSSDSVISYYIDDVDNQRKNSEDLSPAAGRQYGRFGIFIEVKRVNDALYHY